MISQISYFFCFSKASCRYLIYQCDQFVFFHPLVHFCVNGAAAEDSSSVTLYSNSDLLAAIGRYDNKNAKSLDPFKKMADAIVKSKVKAGKTQKEAVGSIKTSITSHYKPLWIAADRKGREDIQNVLKQLKVNGKALYTGEDWTNWNKAAKKKQKKQ